MIQRTSLGRCNDQQVIKFAQMLKQKIIQSGHGANVCGKSYLVSPELIVTRKTSDRLGEVYKFYRQGFNKDWFLKSRQVMNERGSYMRTVDYSGKNVRDAVSLGGQDCFVRQNDGLYLQKGNEKYGTVRASAKQIEAAIDYIKGIGSVENYTKLLRE